MSFPAAWLGLMNLELFLTKAPFAAKTAFIWKVREGHAEEQIPSSRALEFMLGLHLMALLRTYKLSHGD